MFKACNLESKKYTKRLTPNHRTIEHVSSPHYYTILFKGLFTAVPFTQYIILSYQGKITRHTKWQKPKFEEKKQASEQDSLMAGCCNYQTGDLKQLTDMLRV